MKILFILLVPLGGARINVPAVVVEARLAGKLFDLGPRFLFKMKKPNYHVGNLYAGIVDVVLDIHFPAGKSQQTDERVSQHSVAQVSDMRGLVGIDAGVFDQNFAGWSVAPRFFAFDQRSG